MKKLFILLCVGMLWSCNKSMLTETSPSSLGSKNYSKPLYARDGVFDLLGYGYDVTKEYANSNSSGGQVIDIATLNAQNPGRVIPNVSGQQYGKESYGSNAYTYSQKISSKLSATAAFAVFGATITSNYTDQSNLSSTYMYGNYTLMIQQKNLQLNAPIALLQNYLTPAFLADIQNQSPAYIVSHYGTHVCSHIILGGRLQVMYRAQTSASDRTIAAATGLKANVKTFFNVDYQSETTTTTTNTNTNQNLIYSTIGGDPTKTLSGSLIVTNGPPTIDISAWQSSCTPQNSELIDFDHDDGLIPIYDLIPDATKAAAVQSYVNQYMTDNQVKLSLITATIQSNGFYNVFLRLDGSSFVGQTAGSGTANCQYSAGPYEQLLFTKQADGSYSIGSDQFPGLFLRMDAAGVPRNTTAGGGTVNLQNSVGPYEKFKVVKQSDGSYTIESVQFPGVYLRMDARGVTQFNNNGAGIVNCQGLSVGAWEKFTISPALY